MTRTNDDAKRQDATSDYDVSFPDFPGAVTAAPTFEEAVEVAAEALLLHVEGMIAEGHPGAINSRASIWQTLSTAAASQSGCSSRPTLGSAGRKTPRRDLERIAAR